MRFDRIRDRKGLRNGFTSTESWNRLALYYHVLRRILHLHVGWLPRTNPYDLKALLGIHIHQDAEFVAALHARATELDTSVILEKTKPCAATREFFTFLDGIETWEAYIAVAYSVVKPGLIDWWEEHFTGSEPLLCEPTTRLLADLLHVTSQHISGGVTVIEMLHGQPGFDAGPIHESTARARQLWIKISAVIDQSGPAEVGIKPPYGDFRRGSCLTVSTDAGRFDAFDEIRNAASGLPDQFPTRMKPVLHWMMNEDLIRAEVLAETLHRHPDWLFSHHRTFARLIWDRIRHVQALEKVLESMGSHWGEFPISLRRGEKYLDVPHQERLKAMVADLPNVPAKEHHALCESLRVHSPEIALLIDYIRKDNDAMRFYCTHLLQDLKAL